MPTLVDIVRRHGKAYLAKFGSSVLPSHRAALGAITACRTPMLGGHLAKCNDCGHEHVFYHSCRSRACPQCGYDTTSRWLAKQRELLLPVPYFHVVLTLPSELRRLVRSHQKALLSVLFRAAFNSLAKLCADPHFLGAKIGALAVLHTWTRTLEWHPHIHLLVPGGGLTSDGRTWKPVPSRNQAFIVPVKALAKLFRGRFLHLARHALPNVKFPDIPWEKPWIAFAKPVARGPEQVLEYLGRYVHRTALSSSAIVANGEDTVTFRYKDSRTHQRKTMTLPAFEFLRRFLQHVPAKGFHRVRSFGLLHPEHRQTLCQLQLLLTPVNATDAPSSNANSYTKKRTCPDCKSSSLQIVRLLSVAECIAREAAVAIPIPSHARAPPAKHNTFALVRLS